LFSIVNMFFYLLYTNVDVNIHTDAILYNLPCIRSFS